jgi:hypothetical protein
MNYRRWLILVGFICLFTAVYGQWTLEPVPGSATFKKPVQEDTLKVKDFYNSKYSVRVGNSDLTVIGRDTIIIAPLKAQTAVKRLPQLKNDLQLIQQALTYPTAERAGGVQGSCLAYLRINKTGIADSVWVEKGLTKTMDSVIIQAIKKLPPFNPGRQRGKRINAICFYAITYKLFE